MLPPRPGCLRHSSLGTTEPLLAKKPSSRLSRVHSQRIACSRLASTSDRIAGEDPQCKPFAPGTLPSMRQRSQQKLRKGVEVRGASGYGSDDIEAKIRNRKPPSIIQRLLAAFFYIVPWLDIVSLGGEYHRRFVTSIIFLLIPDPFYPIYYSSQFAPLIIFFLLFLSVVKNFRLHHFTRFHCMQAIVLDIVTMLFTLVRQYFPAEIRWSPALKIYDMFAYNVCILTILYCVGFALAGRYADITYVSESTYMQVEEGT